MTENSIKAAAIQLASGPSVGGNLTAVAEQIDCAVNQGAKLLVLPENFFLMPKTEAERLVAAEAFGSGRVQDFLSRQAKKHGIWLVGGTIPLEAEDAHKVRAACLVFNDRGECVARYDKIHLFDVSLPNGETYRESDVFEAGEEKIVVDTPFGRVGLSICYDLRFPELYRDLTGKGARILVVPSAFTATTGRAHWKPLLRARAIENQCYVIAAGQGGFHSNGRETWGHSFIINPWGEVLDSKQTGSGVVVADLDMEFLETVRSRLPALEHRR